MERTLTATYNNRTLLLDSDLPVKNNSRLKVKIQIPKKVKSKSFLQTAMGMDFEAPTDWSSNVDEYLYGVKAIEK